MTLVEIDLTKEPVCLQELRANPVMTYENDLKDECKDEVISLLKISQNNLCAYCQKSIESVMTVEHYIAQSDVDNYGPNLQLNFSNFFGVCIGQFRKNNLPKSHSEYIKPILHCDSSRGNITLNIDPRVSEHIETISYTDDFKIISSDHNFNSDLNNVLNLNIEGICELRQKTFNDYFVKISEFWAGNLSSEFYRKALSDIENNPPEYYGYLKFRFQRLLENEMNRL